MVSVRHGSRKFVTSDQLLTAFCEIDLLTSNLLLLPAEGFPAEDAFTANFGHSSGAAVPINERCYMRGSYWEKAAAAERCASALV
jgi:hypothetical protein